MMHIRYIFGFFVALLSFSSASAGLISVTHDELPVSFSQDKVIVVLKDQPGMLSLSSMNEGLEGFSYSNPNKNMGTVDVKSGDTVADTLTLLQNDPRVLYAQPNYIYTTFSFPTPTDELFDVQWGLDNQGQALQDLGTTGVAGADIGWLSGMNIFTGVDDPSVTGTIIAVIDNGVSYTHEDLQDRMWDGTNCLNQNGGVLGNCLYGYDFYNNDTNPTPSGTDWHGTHVSGIFGATLNASGVVGVNPSSRIMALRAGVGTSLNTLSVVNSIGFAQYNGAKIINASFGGSDNDQLLRDTIASYSGLFIAAAGNNGYNHASTGVYPCDYSFSHVICVGAFTQKNAYASFSDYGMISVDVAAPGVSIASTYNSGNAAYAYSDGTSMATPFVAGIASLLWSYYPLATREQVKQAIFSGVVQESYLSGKVATSGRVNLYNSLLEMQGIVLSDMRMPIPFSFDSVTGAFPNSGYTSNIITFTGLLTGFDVFVDNGFYRINGGAWLGVGETGIVYSGDTLELSLTATGILSSAASMVVYIGEYSTTFSAMTTGPLPGGPTGTVLYSSGYYYNQTGFTIQIESDSGVDYDIFGDGLSGLFTGVLSSGVNDVPVVLSGTTGWNDIRVSLGTSPYITYYTASVLYDDGIPSFITTMSGITITGASLMLTGTVSDDRDLESLTLSGAENNSCDFSLSGLTLCNFSQEIVFPGSGLQYISYDLADKAGNMSQGSIAINVDLTDRMPTVFTYSPVTNAVRSSVHTSSVATITAIDSGVDISVTEGEYRINGGSGVWLSTGGTLYSGDTLEVRLTASAAYSTTVLTTVTVGYYRTSFSVRTVAAPTPPSGGGGDTGGGGGSTACSPSSVTHGTVNSSTCQITCSAGYTLTGQQCVLSSGTGAIQTGQELQLFSKNIDKKIIKRKISTIDVEFSVPSTDNKKFNTLIDVFLDRITADANKNKISASRVVLLDERFERFANALYGYVVGDNTLAKYQLVGDFKTIQGLLKSETINTEFADALAFLYDNGMTSYNTEYAFRPNDNITREQAAKMYTMFMQNVRDIDSQIDDSCVFNDLNDVDTTLLPSVRQACRYGLMKGSDRQFRPQGTLIRAEAVTLTVRALGLTVSTNDPWYKGYIQTAAAQGIIGSASLDGANGTISRRDVAIMLYRASQK